MQNCGGCLLLSLPYIPIYMSTTAMWTIEGYTQSSEPLFPLLRSQIVPLTCLSDVGKTAHSYELVFCFEYWTLYSAWQILIVDNFWPVQAPPDLSQHFYMGNNNNGRCTRSGFLVLLHFFPSILSDWSLKSHDFKSIVLWGIHLGDTQTMVLRNFKSESNVPPSSHQEVHRFPYYWSHHS